MKRNKPDSFLWTRHAVNRRTSRRIPCDALQLVLDWGRSWHHGGRVVSRLDRRSVRQARLKGLDLRSLEGIHAVFSQDGRVITVWRNRTGKRIRR